MHFRLALAGIECVYFPTYTFVYREYESQFRISSTTKAGTQARQISKDIRYAHAESLLLDKYGVMPVLYKDFFASFWFSKAREEFAQKNQNEGKQFLERACTYKSNNRFQKIYVIMGKFMGYINLETLLRLRLCLLHKE